MSKLVKNDSSVHSIRYVAVSPLQRPVRRSVVCEVATKKPDSAVKRELGRPKTKPRTKKVNGIEKAGKSVNTLEDLLDREIQQNTMKDQSSASRSLIRAKRSLEMLKIIFEQTMASSGNSIMDPVNTAYKQVFYPYHGWATRKAVAGALYTLPTKSLFLKKLKLDVASAFVLMQMTVTALAPLIHYIGNLFHSRESAQELLRLI